MSTDAQLKGDSLRRQLQLSLEYAARQGWELAEQDQLRDIGISAFSGANVSGGALGQFLEAIRIGKVQAGSVLIVESLDRLSRQEVIKSLGLFIGILDAGVNIVTLADGRTYTSSSDFADLTFSMAVMSRAHDESRTKSHRVSAAWSDKRRNINTRKLTAKCPSWLRLSADENRFEVLPDRARVVTRIFEESAAGIGSYSIARRLNAARVPTFGRSKGWCSSSIAKLLVNRAVLGEFQPHRFIKGNRVAEGEPIKHYFPGIIPEQLFYRVQDGRAQRRVKGAGRKGPNISNLFSGLIKCAYCRSSMTFENKGAGPRGGTYVVCDGARRGLICERTAWRYDQLEASVLAFVKELDLESLIRNDSESKRRGDLEKEIDALRGKVGSLQEQMDRTFDLLHKSGSAADYVGQRLSRLEEQRLVLVEEIAAKEKERDQLSSELSGFYESKDQIKALLDRLQRSEGEDVYKLRAQISARLKSLVSEILVAPLGSAPVTRKVLDHLKKQDSSERIVKLIYGFEQRLNHQHEHRRFFLITFKDGSARGVYPRRDDPLEFEEQMVASESEGIIAIGDNGREHRPPFKLPFPENWYL